LWQAPVFVLGVGALVAVAAVRPTAARNGGCSFRRDLAEARRLLDRPDGDAPRAARLAERALEEADAAPDAAAEAQFLLGSALLRQAEQRGDHAAEQYAAARLHLEVAERLGVAEADAPRLQYRLGKALSAARDDPARVIARLKPALDQLPHDDPDLVDGYAVLTQAYLRLPQPDLAAALACNKALRDLPQAKEEVLASARLLGGELQLRLGDPEGARKSLERVGPQAPAEVQLKARLLAARSYEDEGRWAEAADLWQKALADDPPKPSAVLYHLGLCCRRLDRPAEAAQFWEKCVGLGAGDDTPAAALALAELRLQSDAPEAALDLLALAVDKVKAPADWPAGAPDLAAVRKLFADAADACTRAGRFDLALKLAEPYGRVAEPGKAAVLRATAAAAWGRARRAKAAQLSADDRAAEEKAAVELLRQAADAYAEAAEAAAPADQAEYLWLSAGLSREAGDAEPTAAKLDRYLRRDDVPDDHKGEGWYELAEARRQLKDAAGASQAYREAVKYQSRWAYLARCQLALASTAAGQLDDAENALELNLKLLRSDPDPEAEEKSLYALGDLAYRRGKYAEVVLRLAEAVGRFKDNPGNTRARFQLATSYRRLADQSRLNAKLGGDPQGGEKVQEKLNEQQRYLHNAHDEFDRLARFLETPEGQAHLTPEERLLTAFEVADCSFDLGNYAQALKEYERLHRLYPNRVEGLEALGGMLRCHAAVGDEEKKGKCMADMQDLFAALRPTMPESDQKLWTEWMTKAGIPRRTEAGKPTATP
jgi:tetratricopeptide (TPR) repeat protein